MLLAEILAATKNMSAPAVEPFQVSTNAVIVNSLWFCSLLISLACALLATLVQDWSRNYTRDVNRKTKLDESLFSRVSNHVHIRLGVDRYHMGEVVDLIVTLVHLSVILFAAGLSVFLFPINAIVAWCTESIILMFMLAYFAISVLSISDTDCPYKTPFTYPLATCYNFLLPMIRLAIGVVRLILVLSCQARLLAHGMYDWSHTCIERLSSPAWYRRTIANPHRVITFLRSHLVILLILGFLLDIENFLTTQGRLVLIWYRGLARPLTVSSKRQVYLPEEALSIRHFIYVWENARDQMLDTAYGSLFETTLLLLQTWHTHSEHFEYLAADQKLATRLRSVVFKAHIDDVRFSTTTCLLGSALFSSIYGTYLDKPDDERRRISSAVLLHLWTACGLVSRVAKVTHASMNITDNTHVTDPTFRRPTESFFPFHRKCRGVSR